MKLVFLHGLGQDAHSWQSVQDALSPLPSDSFAIFSYPSESYQEAKERLTECLQQESEPFILVGLSLGGVLALELSTTPQGLGALRDTIQTQDQSPLSAPDPPLSSASQTGL